MISDEKVNYLHWMEMGGKIGGRVVELKMDGNG
jgi:hypothetical protein